MYQRRPSGILWPRAASGFTEMLKHYEAHARSSATCSPTSSRDRVFLASEAPAITGQVIYWIGYQIMGM